MVDVDTGEPHADLAALGVRSVHRTEPDPGQMKGPLAITFYFAGMTPESFLFSVRCYSSLDPGQSEAQLALDDVLMAVWDLLPGDCGPETWDVLVDEGANALVAVADITVAREDF